MKETRRKKVFWIFCILTVLWMCVIFSFSAQEADESAELSGGTVYFLLQYFLEVPVLKSLVERGIVEYVFRKLAHATEYAILGGFVSGALLHSSGWRERWQLKAILGCMAYAATDEFHQLFVEGRSGQFKDVCIDTAGAAIMVLLLQFYLTFVRHKLKQEANGIV